jgi:undecaprenyl-diphosphatase
MNPVGRSAALLRGTPARFAGALRHGARRLRRTPDPRYPVLTGRLLLVLLLCAAATLMAGLLDVAALSYVRSSRDGAVVMMHAITDIGLAQWYLIPAIATLLVVILADWTGIGYGGRARLLTMAGHAAFVVAAVALSGLLTNLLKIVVGRARPIRFDQVGAYEIDLWSFGYANASFPSGHATTMGAVTAILCLWFPRFTVPIVLFGAFLSTTRIAAQAHYLSDIVAGFSLGALFVIVAARFLAARRTVFRPVEGRLLPAVAMRRPAP